MKNYLIKRCTIFLFAILVLYGTVYPREISGIIESVRPDKIITATMDENPLSNDCVLLDENKKIPFSIVSRYRKGVWHIFAVTNQPLVSGQRIVIDDGAPELYPPLKMTGTELSSAGEPNPYKNEIISRKDNRKMVFVDEGFFRYHNTDNIKTDEEVLLVESFYIDMYEVTNGEYYIFVKSTGNSFPVSWSGEIPSSKVWDCPVRVTYNEAVKYALWAEKRLPTKEEWEKSRVRNNRKRSGSENGWVCFCSFKSGAVFPGGDVYIPGKSVCADFLGN